MAGRIGIVAGGRELPHRVIAACRDQGREPFVIGLRDQADPIRRFSQSRAIGLDMESATIAANGFRFRVPYGTLLIVSDRPMHGELKLPGMASNFYQRQVAQHLEVGVRAMEMLREMPDDRLHSRKLRSFDKAPFQ